MNILLHDYGGYPFIFSLSKELAKRGYIVYHAYSSASGSPQPHFEQSENLKVVDFGKNLEKVKKDSFVSRFFQEDLYGKVVSEGIAEIRPDVVISGNTPLLAQRRIAKRCQELEIPFIFWLQDILSVAAEKVVSRKNNFLGRLVGQFFKSIEVSCLKSAKQIITISNDFNTTIAHWGVPMGKVTVIENWANINDVFQVDKFNSFSKNYGLTNTFNIVYSGTLGMKQNPDILLELARHYRSRDFVRIVVVATGAGVEYIREKIDSEKLTNVILLPLQPFGELSNVLGTADLLLAMLDVEASEYCVPSKILSYYCAGRASLIIVPESNLSVRITRNEKLGLVVKPNSGDELFAAVDTAIKHPDLLKEYGDNARKYAERTFNLEVITDKFTAILKNLVH